MQNRMSVQKIIENKISAFIKENGGDDDGSIIVKTACDDDGI